jgi:hypothetical protein
VKSFHQESQPDLQQTDEETQCGADEFDEAELLRQELVKQRFESFRGKPGDLFDHDPFQIEIVAEIGNIVLHNDGEQLFQFLHENCFQLTDGLLADEHRDHRHGLFQLYAQEMVDMFFRERQDARHVILMRDGLFDISEGEQFLSYDAAEAFGYLALPFGENAMEGEPQYPFRCAWMEEQLQRHPDGEPVDEGGYKGDGEKPPGEMRHSI